MISTGSMWVDTEAMRAITITVWSVTDTMWAATTSAQAVSGAVWHFEVAVWDAASPMWDVVDWLLQSQVQIIKLLAYFINELISDVKNKQTNMQMQIFMCLKYV